MVLQERRALRLPSSFEHRGLHRAADFASHDLMARELGIALLLGLRCVVDFRPESLTLERICRQAELAARLPIMKSPPVDLFALLVTPCQRFGGVGGAAAFD